MTTNSPPQPDGPSLTVSEWMFAEVAFWLDRRLGRPIEPALWRAVLSTPRSADGSVEEVDRPQGSPAPPVPLKSGQRVPAKYVFNVAGMRSPGVVRSLRKAADDELSRWKVSVRREHGRLRVVLEDRNPAPGRGAEDSRVHLQKMLVAAGTTSRGMSEPLRVDSVTDLNAASAAWLTRVMTYGSKTSNPLWRPHPEEPREWTQAYIAEFGLAPNASPRVVGAVMDELYKRDRALRAGLNPDTATWEALDAVRAESERQFQAAARGYDPTTTTMEHILAEARATSTTEKLAAGNVRAASPSVPVARTTRPARHISLPHTP